ncbi:hypothetical protein BZG36_02646 [Bifiguratus adelaidae]|uniref:ADF-H domain-containing protein n=1 Tax=Bifiguratus adelaidae TaxID=1938954 RepID=A0A261Y2T5_9FUNG|nr:hypothetical protein BZG36_02646 [Bifiguratus adelaidae]
MSCDLSDSRIAQAYEAIKSGSEIDWMLLGYNDTRDVISLYEAGSGGLDALRQRLGDEVLYALVRFEGRYLFINYVSNSVSGVRRARALVHGRAVGALFDVKKVTVANNTTAQINFTSPRELTATNLRQRLFQLGDVLSPAERDRTLGRPLTTESPNSHRTSIMSMVQNIEQPEEVLARRDRVEINRSKEEAERLQAEWKAREEYERKLRAERRRHPESGVTDLHIASAKNSSVGARWENGHYASSEEMNSPTDMIDTTVDQHQLVIARQQEAEKIRQEQEELARLEAEESKRQAEEIERREKEQREREAREAEEERQRQLEEQRQAELHRQQEEAMERERQAQIEREKAERAAREALERQRKLEEEEAERRRIQEEMERKRQAEIERRQREEAERETRRIEQERQEAVAKAEAIRQEKERRVAEEQRIKAEAERARQDKLNILSQLDEDSQEVLMSGHLSIQGGGSPFWKRRAFACLPSGLYLYPSELAQNPTTAIPLKNNIAHVQESHLDTLIPNSFQIILKDNKQYTIFCDSKREEQQLFELINHL